SHGKVVHASYGPADLPQIFVSTGRDTRKLTVPSKEVLGGRAIATIDSSTSGAADGVTVEAFLIHPHGRTEDSQQPKIVMIKGGLLNHPELNLDLRTRSFASKGWATVMVNDRSSTGYGQSVT